jgi:hypothetical protein
MNALMTTSYDQGYIASQRTNWIECTYRDPIIGSPQHCLYKSGSLWCDSTGFADSWCRVRRPDQGQVCRGMRADAAHGQLVLSATAAAAAGLIDLVSCNSRSVGWLLRHFGDL